MHAQLLQRKRTSAPQCPHLGLADDPLQRESRVSDAHRCYVGLGRERVDLGHQQRFCLSACHTRCPFLIVSEPESGLLDQIGTWSRNVSLRDQALALGRHARALGDLAQQTWSTARPALTRPALTLPTLGRPALARPALSDPALSSSALSDPALTLPLHAAATPPLTLTTPPPPASAPVTALATASASAPPAALASEVAPAPGATAAAAPGRAPAPALLPRGGHLNPGLQALMRLAIPAAPATPEDATPVGLVTEAVTDTDDADLVAQGIAAIEASDESRAYALFKRATERAPRDPRTWFWRAKTSETIEEVILCLKQAHEFDPNNALIASNLQWAVQRRDAARARPERAPSPVARAIEQRGARAGRTLLALLMDLVFTAAAFLAIATGGVLLFSALPAALRAQFSSNAAFSAIPVVDLSAMTELLHLPLGGGYDAGMAVPYTVAMLALMVGVRLLRADRPFAASGHVSRRTTTYWRS